MRIAEADGPKRDLTRERVESDAREAVEVTARIDRAARGLLGAHELGGPHDLRR